MAGYNPTLSLEQIRFCAEECQRQDSGEMSVYRMCEAYAFVAHSPTFGWDMETMHHLAYLINDPDVPNGYRTTPIYFLDGELAVDAKLIESAMERLFDAIVDERITGLQVYKEFELIHPYLNGNGRLGAIVYNRYEGAMDHPKAPPEIFHEKDARGS